MPSASSNQGLDRFREAVAELTVAGAVAGYLVTRVERSSRWRRPFGLQDYLLIRVGWSDGRQDWLEDGCPWRSLPDLERGVFYWEPDDDEAVEYSVRRLQGSRRDEVWWTYASDWWAGNDSYMP